MRKQDRNVCILSFKILHVELCFKSLSQNPSNINVKVLELWENFLLFSFYSISNSSYVIVMINYAEFANFEKVRR